MAVTGSLLSLSLLVFTCHGDRRKKSSTRHGTLQFEPRNAIECEDNFDGQFDLIYTWWTDHKQTKTMLESLAAAIEEAEQEAKKAAGPAGPASFLNVTGAALGEQGIQQQRELVYNLRGAQKFGLLAHVRYVHILICDETFDKYGPPVDLNFANPRLRLVSTSKLGIRDPGGGLMSKMASLRHIPDLHCWALLLNDDVFPTMKFDVNALFNFETRKQVKYRLDTYSWGFCDGHMTTTCHGPFFFSVCRMAQVEARYQEQFDHLRRIGQKVGETADVTCLYDNMGLEQGWAEVGTEYPNYLKICHTNGGCTEEEYTHPSTMFMNVQGGSFSDEYGGAVSLATLKFMSTYFDTPSIFELPSEAVHKRRRVGLDKIENTNPITCEKKPRTSEGENLPHRETALAVPHQRS